MTKLAVALSGVIWEKCLKLEKCVHIGWPINRDICVSVSACVRLIDRGGTILLQVEAAGKQFEFPLTDACKTIFTVGVGHIDICLAVQGPQKIRVQAKACIGFGPINQCWDIWGTDIQWLTAKEFDALDLAGLGLAAVADTPSHVALVDEYQPVPSDRACGCGRD